MAKPLSQSVPYERAAEIPEEERIANEASGWTTKVVLTAAIVMIVVTVLLCMIGPHIPAGE